MKRFIAFMAVVPLTSSLFASAGVHAARAEEPDPTKSAATKPADNDNKADKSEQEDNSTDRSPAPADNDRQAAEEAAKAEAARKAAEAKKAKAEAKTKVAEEAAEDEAKPTVTIVTPSIIDGNVLLRVKAGEADVTGCDMVLTYPDDTTKVLASDRSIAADATWSWMSESLGVGLYKLTVRCDKVTEQSVTFRVGPEPTKTPTPSPTPTVTPTTSPSPTPPTTPPVLKGKLIVETSCEQVSIDVRDVPDGVSYQVKLDGKAVSYDEGAIKVAPGAHVITLVVGGKVVDTVKVAIEACAPEATKVTLKLQVDKYSTKTKKLRSKAAGYDNDGKLKKGEDKAHYGKSVWEIVTVTGTTETTKAEWIAKINKATKKVPNLKGGKKWTVKALKAVKAKSATFAWIIKGDGQATAWYKGNTRTKVPQRFFATNRR